MAASTPVTQNGPIQAFNPPMTPLMMPPFQPFQMPPMMGQMPMGMNMIANSFVQTPSRSTATKKEPEKAQCAGPCGNNYNKATLDKNGGVCGHCVRSKGPKKGSARDTKANCQICTTLVTQATLNKNGGKICGRCAGKGFSSTGESMWACNMSNNPSIMCKEMIPITFAYKNSGFCKKCALITFANYYGQKFMEQANQLYEQLNKDGKLQEYMSAQMNKIDLEWSEKMQKKKEKQQKMMMMQPQMPMPLQPVGPSTYQQPQMSPFPAMSQMQQQPPMPQMSQQPQQPQQSSMPQMSQQPPMPQMSQQPPQQAQMPSFGK